MAGRVDSDTGAVAPVSGHPWKPRGQGQPMVVPDETRAVAWRELYAGPGDFAFTVGPPSSFPDPNGVLTHLTIAGAGHPPADSEGARPAIATTEPARTEPSVDTDVPARPGLAPRGQPAQASDGRLPAEAPSDDHVPSRQVPPNTASAPPGTHDRPPPGAHVPTAYPCRRPAGFPRSEPDDRRRAGMSFHERQHEAGPMRDSTDSPDEDAERRAHTGSGLFRRAGHVLKSLVGPEARAEHDADPSAPRTSPARPTRGPAGDLEYWQQAEATQPPPGGGPRKPVPPEDNNH